MDANKFWSRVNKTTDNGCWLWIGATAKFGHGSLRWEGKTTSAHRVAFTLTTGQIPDGLCVLHHCDVPACIRPEHLFLGTKKDNTQDMVQKGRARGGGLRGERNAAAKLQEADVRAIRASYIPRLVSLNRLARDYGVSKRAILFILQGRNWPHVKPLEAPLPAVLIPE